MARREKYGILRVYCGYFAEKKETINLDAVETSPKPMEGAKKGTEEDISVRSTTNRRRFLVGQVDPFDPKNESFMNKNIAEATSNLHDRNQESCDVSS